MADPVWQQRVGERQAPSLGCASSVPPASMAAPSVFLGLIFCPSLVLEFGQAPLPPPFPGSQEGFRAGNCLAGVVPEEDPCPDPA